MEHQAEQHRPWSRPPALKAGVVYLDHMGERWFCVRVGEGSATVRALGAAKTRTFITATGDEVAFAAPARGIEICPRPVGWAQEGEGL